MTFGAWTLEVIHHIMHYKSFLFFLRFLLSLDPTADLPTCCRKGHMARGSDLPVLPCWSVRPQCATPTLSDRPCEHMHENWYLHKGLHHSSAAVMDWDSARVHSGLGPGTAVNRFVLWAVNGSSKATGTLPCTSMTFLSSWLSGETSWLKRRPRLLSSIFH